MLGSQWQAMVNLIDGRFRENIKKTERTLKALFAVIALHAGTSDVVNLERVLKTVGDFRQRKHPEPQARLRMPGELRREDDATISRCALCYWL